MCEYLPGLSPVAVEVSEIEALRLAVVLTIKVVESHVVGLVLSRNVNIKRLTLKISALTL